MFKKFKFTAYNVYDSTEGWAVTEFPLQTIETAKRFVKEREASRRTKHQIYNSTRPFEHHRYIIEELIGTTEWEFPDDDYREPSFYELCETVDKWRSGKCVKLNKFDDYQ